MCSRGLHDKGIFTITQLAYTFRPRRRSRHFRDKREKYHHACKALAIREHKIHSAGRPALAIEGTPVYLDVEGLPDRDLYYLIGVRIGDDGGAVQHSLWADTDAEEEKIWRAFLGIDGLKARFLRKHRTAVARFYREIAAMPRDSETVTKFRERFEKTRDRLFTFLDVDGVPWNNNNAEHAVKSFAALRHVFEGVTSERGIRDYLVLLSVSETCKYMGIDFLTFLRSGETDLHAFAQRRQRVRRRFKPLAACVPG